MRNAAFIILAAGTVLYVADILMGGKVYSLSTSPLGSVNESLPGQNIGAALMAVGGGILAFQHFT